jgi:branched-chain amino acid transport system ATP-binding protein
LLAVKNIESVYSNVVLALSGISLNVPEKSIVVILGSNGSGKSTTLKSISGVLETEEGRLTRGQIEFDGKSLTRLNPEKIAALGVCHVLQGRGVFAHLTAEENLLMGAYLRRDRTSVKKDLDRVYQYLPRLGDLKKRRGGYLSGGEQQMLVIGRALMARPKLMLLDEPSIGLAPRVIEEIFTLLKRINEEEKTALLIAEQNARAALSIAGYGYVLENGHLVLEGAADFLLNHPQVKESYLGLNASGTEKNYQDVKTYQLRRSRHWGG